MAIQGSCLCGGFRFEIDQAAGPFELCHCNRCRKVSGSASLAALGVRAEHYRVLAGSELVRTYEAPLLNRPPTYHAHFCSVCGSPLPPPEPDGWFEVPAGLLDGDPGLRPDKHIFLELAAAWDVPADTIPRFTLRELAAERDAELPDHFELVTHHGRKYRV